MWVLEVGTFPGAMQQGMANGGDVRAQVRAGHDLRARRVQAVQGHREEEPPAAEARERHRALVRRQEHPLRLHRQGQERPRRGPHGLGYYAPEAQYSGLLHRIGKKEGVH